MSRLMIFLALTLLLAHLCAAQVAADATGAAATAAGTPDDDSLRITNGIDSDLFRSVPYLSFGGTFCSGVLVHKQWILTAAHCVRNRASSTTVRIGAPNPRSLPPLPVAAVYSLKDYNTVSLDADIALIKLKARYGKGRPIGVLRNGNPQPTAGDPVVAAGFGLIDMEPNRYSTNLQEATLQFATSGNPVYVHSDCRAWHKKTNRKQLTVCAVSPMYPTGTPTSTCGGDSGGPLIWRFTKKNGKTVNRVLGLNSFSRIRCNKPNAIDYFARVPTYAGAIVNLIKKGDSSAWNIAYTA